MLGWSTREFREQRFSVGSRRASTAADSRSTASSNNSITALSAGFTWAILSKCADISSTDEIFPLRIK
jgi:hypothetical protein